MSEDDREDLIVALAEQLRMCSSELELITNTGSLDVGKALSIVTSAKKILREVE